MTISNNTNMAIEDLALAVLALGLSIDRWEKSNDNSQDLLRLKHAYIRLDKVLAKAANYSLQESHEAASLLMRQADSHESRPGFLPCRKSESLRQKKPCIRHDEECHCAQLLQCELLDVSSYLALLCVGG